LFNLNNVIDFPLNEKKILDGIVDDMRRGNGQAALKKANALIDDGHPAAYWITGCVYEVQKEFDKAKLYYEMAIEKNQSDAIYISLARLHVNKCAPWSDYAKAFEYYKLAVERGAHKLNKAFANFMLGKMYYLGWSVDVDYKKARQYFEKGWEDGNIIALAYLGRTEEKLGNYFKGIKFRLMAGMKTFVIIGIKNREKWKTDPRLKGMQVVGNRIRI
jgi:TPR repeat protein